MTRIMTLSQHVQQHAPELAKLFEDLAVACKHISWDVNRAGLLGILGEAGQTSHQGDAVKKLDLHANDILIDVMGRGGSLCAMGSEEDEHPIPLPEDVPKGEFVMLFDPLDGSSNIDANVSIGTIFGVFRKVSDDPLANLLQPGKAQVAAGYCVYGPSTMLVYTAGDRVDGFTLDPSVGEFLLTHPDIRTPGRGKIYSVNEVNEPIWDAATRKYVAAAKARGMRGRYIGSLVADFHRNLLYGGIFLYPDDCSEPANRKSKLRLLYEGNPLAFVSEAAGGGGTTGTERILDIVPTDLHQRAQLVLGSSEDVAEFEGCVAEQ